jgi:hypothetical protein
MTYELQNRLCAIKYWLQLPNPSYDLCNQSMICLDPASSCPGDCRLRPPSWNPIYPPTAPLPPKSQERFEYFDKIAMTIKRKWEKERDAAEASSSSSSSNNVTLNITAQTIHTVTASENSQQIHHRPSNPAAPSKTCFIGGCSRPANLPLSFLNESICLYHSYGQPGYLFGKEWITSWLIQERKASSSSSSSSSPIPRKCSRCPFPAEIGLTLCPQCKTKNKERMSQSRSRSRPQQKRKKET